MRLPIHKKRQTVLCAKGSYSILATTLILVCLSLPSNASVREIIADSTYIMGDGETPTFAESMALQKAKQSAIEQAGTYIESFTEVKNLRLTTDEIRTIASGLIEAETLEKKRVLEGDGLRVYVKIRAKVTTENMSQLVPRVKGGSAVADFKQLQNSFAQLMNELETLKRQVADTRNESERIDVLNKIREVEKEFRVVESNERAFHKRFISGQELSGLVEARLREEERKQQEAERKLQMQKLALERVLKCLSENGHTIDIGPPVPQVALNSQMVRLRFVVKAMATPQAKEAILSLDKTLGPNPGPFGNEADEKIVEVLDALTLILTVTLKDGKQYVAQQAKFHNFKSPRTYDLRSLANDHPREQELFIDIPRHLVGAVSSVEASITPQ